MYAAYSDNFLLLKYELPFAFIFYALTSRFGKGIIVVYAVLLGINE